MLPFRFQSAPAEARRLAGEKLALMGGTSNIDVVRNGTPESIAQDIARNLDIGIDIVGPERTIRLDAPYENLRIIANVAKKQGAEST